MLCTVHNLRKLASAAAHGWELRLTGWLEHFPLDAPQL
jgi:hypothetical protein